MYRYDNVNSTAPGLTEMKVTQVAATLDEVCLADSILRVFLVK